MNWLSMKEVNVNDIIKNAMNYWSGEKTTDPFMESLLKPEIKIIYRLITAFKFNLKAGKTDITFEEI